MHLVIDMQGAQSESSSRGIGRYTISLVKAIVRNNTSHEITLVLNALFPESIELIRAAFNELLDQEKIRVWYSPTRVSAQAPENADRRKVAEQLREDFIASLDPDIVFITSMFEGYCNEAVTSVDITQKKYKTVSMLYDLIPLIFQEKYLEPNGSYKKFYGEKLAELIKSDAWLTISECSKKDASSLLGIDGDLITNISAACDESFRHMHLSSEDERELKGRWGVNRPFILYTGGADFRKNISKMILIFSKLSPGVRSKFQFVLVGNWPVDSKNQFEDLTKKLNLNSDEVLFLGHVSDYHLNCLYNLSFLYFFGSLYEGFGLPILEAMRCNLPVIASQTSSLSEIIADDNAMFDPLDDQDILDKLERALTDNIYRDSLIENGRNREKLFSWDKTAINFLEAIDSLCSETIHSQKTKLSSSDADALISKISPNISELEDDDLWTVASAIALNHPSREIKKIFVDISELIQRDAATGVQRVTKNVLNQLLLQPPEGYEVEAVYATADGFGYKKANRSPSENLIFIANELDDFVEPISGDIFLGLDLQHHITSVQFDYLKSIRNHGVLIYFVVYDLLPIQFPHYWPSQHSFDLIHSEWLKLITQFDGAICISRAVANELIDWLNQSNPQRLSPFNVGWFHLGADLRKVNSSRMAESVDLDLGDRLNFLMVGTLEPRKGYSQALDAFEQLWDEGMSVNLLIVGKQGWLVDDLCERIKIHPRKDVNLFWFDSASDSQLEQVYMKSDCLIAASEGEGFGLPLIEAAQYKLPIIARDIPVFREVAEGYANFFAGKKGYQLSAAIKEWIVSFDPAQGQKSSLKYLTWEESAEQLKDVFIKNNWHLKWLAK